MRDILGLFDVAERIDARSRVEGRRLAVHALGGDGHAYMPIVANEPAPRARLSPKSTLRRESLPPPDVCPSKA